MKYKKCIPFKNDMIGKYVVFSLDKEPKYFNHRDLAYEYGKELGIEVRSELNSAIGNFLIRKIISIDC